MCVRRVKHKSLTGFIQHSFSAECSWTQVHLVSDGTTGWIQAPEGIGGGFRVFPESKANRLSLLFLTCGINFLNTWALPRLSAVLCHKILMHFQCEFNVLMCCLYVGCTSVPVWRQQNAHSDGRWSVVDESLVLIESADIRICMNKALFFIPLTNKHASHWKSHTGGDNTPPGLFMASKICTLYSLFLYDDGIYNHISWNFEMSH